MKPRPLNVLLALTDTHHGYLKGLVRYAREHGWQLVMDMIYTAQIPHGWKGDGIVSFTGFRQDLADFIQKSGVPTVEVSFLRPDLEVPKVGGDDETIGRLAAEHFIERGYKNYAWAPFMKSEAGIERFESFSQQLGQRDLICHELPPLGFSWDTGGTSDWSARRKQLIHDLLQLPKPLAVFAFNDCVACDVISACEEAGIPVPESVAVLGVDNDLTFCDLPGVDLSSVCHDLEGIAYQAAALLDRIMAGEKSPPAQIRVQPKGIVTRRSTDILSVNNLHVARALRFIRDSYQDSNLDVSEVVKAVGISRRSLEYAFQSELERSIAKEISRYRLEKVAALILGKQHTISEIASLTGFTRPNHLYRLFKKQFGVTPNSYKEGM